MNANKSHFYTPAEVASVLRVTEETVRREIRREQLGALQVGRQDRITAPDLIAWLGQERYVELFKPHEALPSLLGGGALGEDIAASEATTLVRRARAETSRHAEAEAPPPDEVARRRG